MLGATAAEHHASLIDAMVAMSGEARLLLPDASAASLHERRYQAFQVLQRAGAEVRSIK
jgi:ribulose kinase